MAPISRCDLKLPDTSKSPPKWPKSAIPTNENAPGSAKSKPSDPDASARDKDSASGKGSARGKDTDSAGKSSKSGKSGKSRGPGSTSSRGSKGKPISDTTDSRLSTASERSKSQSFADDLGIELQEKEDAENENIPQPADGKHPRDWGEVLEEDSEFRTSVTRDSYEAEQHAGHDFEGSGGSDDTGGLDACEILRQCKAEVEEATAAGECQQMTCPKLDQIGTPGDVCAQFCHDRMDSPKSVAELEMSSSSTSKYCAKWSKKGRIECDMGLGRRKGGKGKKEVVCKGTYKTEETYVALWGSSKANDFRRRAESQMKKKRNLLEKMHRKDFLRRQKMRRRAKEKRRALKQRDPSKISNGDDNLRINKAYDLRVNFNKQLPMMPITMQQHFDKFKKPPFKTYVTGQRVCTKRIDEFEKLRVPEKDKK